MNPTTSRNGSIQEKGPLLTNGVSDSGGASIFANSSDLGAMDKGEVGRITKASELTKDVAMTRAVTFNLMFEIDCVKDVPGMRFFRFDPAPDDSSMILRQF